MANSAHLNGSRAVVSRRRYREPHSGQAIALNSFLPWQHEPYALKLFGSEGFRDLRFAARCPTGIRGTPPHIDLIAASPDEIVAVTARSLEYLNSRRSTLAETYLDIAADRSFDAWKELAHETAGAASPYVRVDLAALIKIAYGLHRTFPRYRITLAYLFWEPDGVENAPVMVEHRRQLEELTKRVENSGVAFSSSSFQDLWRQWQDLDGPHWVPDLLSQLQRRFTVSLAD